MPSPSSGFARRRSREIARRADVSTGLVSFYFGDKDGLLEATLRHLARELSRGVAVRLRDADDAARPHPGGHRRQSRRRASSTAASPRCGSPSGARCRIRRASRASSASISAASPPISPTPCARSSDRAEAWRHAEAIASMIDGLWLRATLSAREPNGRSAREIASAFVDAAARDAARATDTLRT